MAMTTIDDNLAGGERKTSDIFHPLAVHFAEHEVDTRSALGW
jgi:hypothetical protein